MMRGIAFTVNSHVVVNRIDDKAVGFIRCNIGIYDKETISCESLNRSVQVKTLEQIFCATRIEIDLDILRVKRVEQQLKELRLS